MNIPLCVDLDGTLIKSDLLFESFLLLVKKNPFFLFFCVMWLFKGKANFKHQIAKRIEINPAQLPYTTNFLDYLLQEKANGRKIILTTASNQKLAQQVADHLGIFSEVIASDNV